GRSRRASMRRSVLLLTVIAGVATSVAVLSAQRPQQPLFPGQPAPAPRTALLFPVLPPLVPVPQNDANALPNFQPRVVCGMTLIPAPPSADPKIAKEPPEKPRNPTTYTIRPVQPSICW